MERIIIGLTGPSAGGKGEVSKILIEKGFTYFSLSDIIRVESNKRKWGEGRATLQNLGDELRASFGSDILAVRTVQLNKFKHADNVVIDSIRHPDEILYLKEFFEAKIIGVDAPIEKLFVYSKLRKRDGDPKTFEEYKKSYDREIGVAGGSAMQVVACLDLADMKIQNTGDKEHLRREVEKHLNHLGIEGVVNNHEMHGHGHGHGHEHH